jgi:hypothetical protein
VSEDPTHLADEETRYLRLRQPGALRQLLATPLADLTVGDLLEILRAVDQARHLREAGIARD